MCGVSGKLQHKWVYGKMILIYFHKGRHDN